MLVFFPSYTVMASCIDWWKQYDTWNRITAHKPVYVEPKDKSALAEVMAQYHSDVRSKEEKKGAAFFAVCRFEKCLRITNAFAKIRVFLFRGKVSEGLDFADVNGRAVLITGLPYPPQFDPRVRLKMEYLDSMSASAKKDPSAQINQAAHMMDGRTWYQQQALRAVNQAIGRVLRHKNDYGAILLCDERFSYANNTSHLSSWIKPSILSGFI